MDTLDTDVRQFFVLAEQAAQSGRFRVSADGTTANQIAGEISNQTRLTFNKVVKNLMMSVKR